MINNFRDSTPQPKRVNVFNDIDLSFDLNPVTLDLKTIKDVDVVKQSIRNLILCKKLWNFDNIDLNQLTFESIYSILENTVILSNIEQRLMKLEPRLRYIKIDTFSQPREGIMQLDITFQMKTFINQTFSTTVFKRIFN